MKLFKDSSECTKSELDLLLIPPTQTAVLSGKWVEIPTASVLLGDGVIDFIIPGIGEQYYDLANSYVYLIAEIVTTNANNSATVVTGIDVAPVNNFFHSLFNQVDITAAGTLLTQSSNLYSYRSMFETQLNHSQDAKESFLGAALFYKDTAGKMEYADRGDNEGYKRRKKLTSGKPFELMGRLNADIFLQDRYLINGVPLTISLKRNGPNFCLMGPEKYTTTSGTTPTEQTLKYAINITKASFFSRQVVLNPDVLVAHALALEKTTAKYPIKKVEMKMVSIAASTSTYSTNLYSGVMPQRVVLGIVNATALTGSIESNPFNFQHFDIRTLELTVNSVAVPFNKITTNFGNGITLQAYSSLYSGIDKMQEGNYISREDYNKGGYSLFAFDLTSDLCSGAHLDLIETGTLTIEIGFGTTLASAVNLIVYMEQQNIIEVTRDRNVITDFKS